MILLLKFLCDYDSHDDLQERLNSMMQLVQRREVINDHN